MQYPLNFHQCHDTLKFWHESAFRNEKKFNIYMLQICFNYDDDLSSDDYLYGDDDLYSDDYLYSDEDLHSDDIIYIVMQIYIVSILVGWLESRFWIQR